MCSLGIKQRVYNILIEYYNFEGETEKDIIPTNAETLLNSISKFLFNEDAMERFNEKLKDNLHEGLKAIINSDILNEDPLNFRPVYAQVV